MLTNKQARAILGHIKLGGMFEAFNPVFDITGAGDPETGICRMYLTINVPDRDTGRPFEAVFNLTYPAPNTADDVAHLARAITHHAMMHEADESLRVDGHLPFNPHK